MVKTLHLKWHVMKHVIEAELLMDADCLSRAR